MAEPYIGEIRMFAGNFAPQGYQLCQGQTLPISDYEVLFNLIGTTYGGDGQSTFNLPNLQSRVAIHQGADGSGNSYVIAQKGGQEAVILTASQLPVHGHALAANNTVGAATATSGSGALFGATTAGTNVYGTGATLAALSTKAISATGNSQPHSNVKPYQCINFIIATEGVYPSQN